MVDVHADAAAFAADLGGPAEWLASALDHLRNGVRSATDGSATVSCAALDLALMHIEKLEGTNG